MNVHHFSLTQKRIFLRSNQKLPFCVVSRKIYGIFQKLDVRNIVEAVAYAQNHQLI